MIYFNTYKARKEGIEGERNSKFNLKESNIIKLQRILYKRAFKELKLKRSIIANTPNKVVLPRKRV